MTRDGRSPVPSRLRADSTSLTPIPRSRRHHADLALLAMFNGSSATVEAAQQASSPGSTSVAPANDASNAVVLGQALCPPAGPQGGALGALPPPALAMGSSLAPPNPVQQLQLQAVMQHQAAIMQNPQAFPVAAQMYQQHFLAAQQQAATAAPLMPTKRGKTQEEIEEQTERIKKRRRESAQRRWARVALGCPRAVAGCSPAQPPASQADSSPLIPHPQPPAQECLHEEPGNGEQGAQDGERSAEVQAAARGTRCAPALPCNRSWVGGLFARLSNCGSSAHRCHPASLAGWS